MHVYREHKEDREHTEKNQHESCSKEGIQITVLVIGNALKTFCVKSGTICY